MMSLTACGGSSDKPTPDVPDPIGNDFDNDGIPDSQDTDDDNDGTLDIDDAFPLDASESVDTDGDGIGNNSDLDDDNDNVLDENDVFPLDASESVDTDGDGIGNNADIDDDNDNVLDESDAFPLDASESVDTDGDGIGNNADLDDDNDNVSDENDAFPLDASESVDTDGDGIGNNADTDDDNDGVVDEQDAFPLDAKEFADTDGDGIGNNGDIDDDNDGINDAQDAFPLDASESIDTDGDGIGNNADTDDDNDNVVDEQDAFPLDATESVDTDGDGIGNNADTDDDNDGISDENDAMPLDTDNDGINNAQDSDDDNDGIPDVDDAFPLDANESIDTDNDGTGDNADFYDTDAACFTESDGNGSQCYLTWMVTKDNDNDNNLVINKVLRLNDSQLVYAMAEGTHYNENIKQILIQNPESGHFVANIQNLDLEALIYHKKHKRLYSASNQKISFLNANFEFVNFAEIGINVSGSTNTKLASVGNYLLLLHNGSSEFATPFEQKIYNEAGSLLSTAIGGYSAFSFSWNEQTETLNFLTWGYQESGTQRDYGAFSIEVNQQNGMLGKSKSHYLDYTARSFSIEFQLVTSQDGTELILNDGDIYNKSTGAKKYLGHEFKSAYLTENNELISINTPSYGVPSNTLRRESSDFNALETLEISGHFKA